MSRKRAHAVVEATPKTSYLPTTALAGMFVLYLFWFYWPASENTEPTIAQQLRIGSLALLVSPEALVANWFGNGKHVGFLDRLPVIAVAALILVAALGWGGLLLRRIGLTPNLTRLEHLVFSTSAGLSCLSLFTLLAGLAERLHYSLIFWCVLVYGGALAVAQEALRRKDVSPQKPLAFETVDEQPPWLRWVARICLVLFGLVILLGAMLPPWEFDVREYHLQAPKEWYQQGKITFMPHNVYANMPLGAEMHSLLAMTVMPGERGWWYGALAGKLVMASFTLLTGLSLVAAGRRFLGSSWGGWVGALVYVAQPWIVHTSVQGLNEPAVANFTWLAVYCCLLAREATAGSESWRTYALAGFFAGSAVACKYPALLFVAVPLGLWLVAQTLWVSNRNFKPVFAFVLGAAVTCGPWLVKNWVLAGNPTYPLLVSVFGGETRTPEKDAQWRKAHQVPTNAQGEKYSPRQLVQALRQVLIDSEFLSQLTVPLIGGLLLSWGLTRGTRQPAPEIRPLSSQPTVFVVAMLASHLGVWWLATHRIDRFWTPALPYAAFLAGAGAIACREPVWRWTAAGLVAAGLLMTLPFVASPAVGDNRWFVSLEALRTDAGAEANDFKRLNPAHAWLNAEAKPGEAVLLVGDAQPFDLELPVFYSTCFDDCWLVTWTRDNSASQRRKELVERGIRYVLIDWGEIERYRSPGNYGFPPEMTRDLTAELVTQKVIEPVQTFGNRELYRVRTAKRREPAASR